MSATFQTMHNTNYYRQSPLSVDTHSQKYFDEDESTILDENILEHNGSLDSALDMSPPLDGSRRHSFAVSSAMFSPKPEEWQQTVDMQATPSNHGYSNNPFVEQHSNNPFMRLDQQQAATYGQQSFGWPMVNGSGSCTPMQPHDGLPTDFDGNMHYRPMPNQTPFSNPATTQVPVFSQANTESMPASPEKHWMSQENMEHQGMPKRMRPHSPMLRSHSPLMRRTDGIRKKNARFDIPAERNLLNIDQLIAHSVDEQEIKELKQQKRLLRNRQAALDSRQRKKQHTERLEDEKKHFTQMINDLEEEVAEMRIVLDEQVHREAEKDAQYRQYIEGLQLEKEEMVRQHTIETGDLRKKVSVLSEHIKQIENTTMSAVPSSTGFSSAEYSDIDALTMDGAWENISFLDDFSLENEVKTETSIVPAKKAAMESEDKPAAHGLLLMLLLCGALVASRGSTPSIPRMSDDLRAASATILDDIFKDAGVQNQAPSASIMEAGAPSATGTSWSSAPTTAMIGNGNNNMVGVSSSMLEELADQLAQPSEQQKNEQLFSLSAAQYDGLTSQDFLTRNSQNQGQATRRNLAESLAAMRRNSKDSAAEVYTRSLLWDQVPSEVVRNFAKMVADCNPEGMNDCDASISTTTS